MRRIYFTLIIAVLAFLVFFAPKNISAQSPTPGGSVIKIYALGTSDAGVFPNMELRINDVAVRNFTVTGTMAEYSYTHTSTVPANQIKVAYTNDSNLRDLRVDRINVDGIDYQSEASSTYNTGFWNGTYCGAGYYQSEWIYCNGYFAYDQFASSPSPSIPPPTGACTLTGASWSAGSVIEGSTVNLNISTSGDCSGRQISFEVRRNIALQPDQPAQNAPSPNPVNLTLSNGKYIAASNWTADTWQNACTLGSCDPEYFFKVNLVGNPTTIESNPRLITVTRPIELTDWPQLGRSPQRTQYHPSNIQNPPLPLKWAKALTDYGVEHRIYAAAQVITANVNGRQLLFIGSKSGTLFALNSNDGSLAWRFDSDGPILHTVGFEKGRVFLANMKGSVYALDAASGNQIWRFNNNRRFGFAGAVLLAEGKVFSVDTGGYLYALSQNNGSELWHYDAGAFVVSTPSYDNGKIFLGSEDMLFHAVNSLNGSRIWVSRKLDGMSFADTWAVIVKNVVVVTTMTGFEPRYDNQDPYRPEYFKGLYALDSNTGNEIATLPYYSVGSMNGPHVPPAITKEERLVLQWYRDQNYASASWLLAEATSGAIIDTANGGFGAADESLAASVFGDTMLSMHHMGYGWGNPDPQGGFYNWSTKTWTPGSRDSNYGAWGSDNSQAGRATAMTGTGNILFHQSDDVVRSYAR